MSARMPFAATARYVSDQLHSLPAPVTYNGALKDYYGLIVHPALLIGFGSLYVLIVTHLNRSRPNGRNLLKGPVAKSAVLLHNAFLAIYSAWTFAGIAPAVISHFASALAAERGMGIFRRALCDADGELWQSHISDYGILFYLSKYYEVVDTAIILAKGKKAATLQIYHHVGAMVCMFMAMRGGAVPIWLFIFLNSAIHTIMYTYYSFSTVGLPFPRFLKRSLTSLQITQFVLGIPFAASYLLVRMPKLADPSIPSGRCVKNPVARAACVTNIAYFIPLLHLFWQFFVQSYLQPENTKAPRSKASKEL